MGLTALEAIVRLFLGSDVFREIHGHGFGCKLLCSLINDRELNTGNLIDQMFCVNLKHQLYLFSSDYGLSSLAKVYEEIEIHLDHAFLISFDLFEFYICRPEQ